MIWLMLYKRSQPMGPCVHFSVNLTFGLTFPIHSICHLCHVWMGIFEQHERCFVFNACRCTQIEQIKLTLHGETWLWISYEKLVWNGTLTILNAAPLHSNAGIAPTHLDHSLLNRGHILTPIMKSYGFKYIWNLTECQQNCTSLYLLLKHGFNKWHP